MKESNVTGRLLTIRALTPIHSGIGQDTGAIDLAVVLFGISNL
jgi:hypothetical protein